MQTAGGLEAALNGGATRLVLCDTNGGSLPGEVTEIVGAVVATDDPVQVQLSAHSVLGQCLLYKHAEAAMERIHN
ncbi:MAG: hypothetical protein ACPGVU_14120, partial [Limisphaerales bacterium]